MRRLILFLLLLIFLVTDQNIFILKKKKYITLSKNLFLFINHLILLTTSFGNHCHAIMHQSFVTTRILTPGRFSVAKGGAKNKVLTSSLPPGGGAYSRALKAVKS